MELFNIKGKVVLITGGARGVGLMIAEGFIQAGCRVYLCSRDEKALSNQEARLSKMAEKVGGFCKSFTVDLQHLDQVEALVEKFAKFESKLDVLVNNAGANWAERIETFPEQAWDKLLTLNVKRIFTLSQKFLPFLEKAATAEDPARIINIGSVNGIQVPGFPTFAYSTSKAGVHHLTKHLAARLAARHITVNAVAPGPFPSKMTKAVLEEGHDAIVEGIPLQRIGKSEDMAGVCIYLASKASSYVTGVVIPVDGGLLIYPKF